METYTSANPNKDWCFVRVCKRTVGDFSVGVFDKESGDNAFDKHWIFKTEDEALSKKDELLK